MLYLLRKFFVCTAQIFHGERFSFWSIPPLPGIGNSNWAFFTLFVSGPVCWKDKKLSYGRGVGTIPSSCPSHRPDKWGGLCYKRCRDGYRPFGCCLCKRGWSSYPRGVGVVPKSCPSSKPDKHAGLCYKKCRTEYKGVSFDWCACLSSMPSQYWVHVRSPLLWNWSNWSIKSTACMLGVLVLSKHFCSSFWQQNTRRIGTNCVIEPGTGPILSLFSCT